MPQMNDQEIDAFLGPSPGGEPKPPAPQPAGPMSDADINTFLDATPKVPSGTTEAPAGGTPLEAGLANRIGVPMMAKRTYASVATPEQNDFLANTSMGRILAAAGSAPQEVYDNSAFFTPEFLKSLKGPDGQGVQDGQKSLWDGFKNGVLYPAAAELDRQFRIGMTVFQAPIMGLERAAEQTGEEISPDVGLGHDFARVVDFLAQGAPGMHLGVPDVAPAVRTAERLNEARQQPAGSPLAVANENAGVPPQIQAARAVGAIGQPPSVYFGLEEPHGQVNDNVYGPAINAEAPPNVHEAARQLAPETFTEYDALNERQYALRQQIAEQADKLQSAARAQVPNAARIEEIEGRMEGASPKQAAKYQEWLDRLTPARDEFMNSGKWEMLTRDTDDLTALRQELQSVDHRMGALSPMVTQAYAKAAEAFPVEEAAPEAPEPEIAEASRPTTNGAPADAIPTVETAAPPAPEAQTGTETGTSVGHVPEQPVEDAPGKVDIGQDIPKQPAPDIAATVSAKLQAAGRPAEEANAAAAVEKALWETRAARFNGTKGTAAEMYAREGADIRAGKGAKVPEFAQKGRTLEQAGAQTETPEFKRWFGKSKVVGEDGKPLVVYKGMHPYDWTKETPESAGPEIESINRTTEFPAFNKGEAGVKIAGFFGDKDTAGRFANNMNGAVYPTFLKMEKPFVIDAAGEKAGNIQFGESGKAFRDAIRSGKYDGVIIKNTADEGTVYVALKPEQIKSAIGNRGTFDPHDARILYQAGAAQTETPEFKRWFGKSKAVDAEGKPLTLYHGTVADFDTFSADFGGERGGGEDSRRAFFFTTEPEVANSYAVGENPYRKGVLGKINKATGGIYEKVNEAALKKLGFSSQIESGENIMPTYLKAENPHVVDMNGNPYDKNRFLGELHVAQQEGHDAVVFKNVYDNGFKDADKTSDVWAVFRPEQIKSAIGNRGTFDPHDARINYQGAQGKIRLTEDGRSVITLMKTANASTFIHETGHDWLERMMRDAADTQAPDDLKADAATIRKYLGVNEGDAIPEEAHEKFARSFERYMMEGRAPSTALLNVFAKFQAWLITIYKTVKKLDAPITDDIRAVFDRMLATPDERTSIVPETEAESREFVTHAAPEARPGATDLYTKIKEPERLASYLRRMGGVQDVGGDIKHILGGSKYRPGLINKRGLTLDDATLRAHEVGYFPEFSMDDRPAINDLLNALEGDIKGHEPRYSHFDESQLEKFNEAKDRNAEIERLAAHYNIDTTGMSRQQFENAISEHLSVEQQAREQQSMAEASGEDYEDWTNAARDWLEEFGEEWSGDEHRGIEGSRSEQELEDAYRSENAAGHEGQELPRGEGPVSTGAHSEPGQVGGGQGGRGAADAGRAEGTLGATGPADGDATGSERGAEPKPPTLDPINVDAPRKFGTKNDDEILKAANIRLDKINAPDDVNRAAQEIAAENNEYFNSRYGAGAYRGKRIVAANNILVRATADEAQAAAAKFAQSGKVEDFEDLLAKRQRAAMAWSKAAELRADWAHTGHEFQKVMLPMERVKAIDSMMKRTDGMTLFQMQQEAAALMTRMETAEQVGIFAKDMERSGWDVTRSRIIAYYVNALISGPLTHAAYMVGNTVWAMYRAGPLTALQAGIGAIHGGTDRAYFGEIGAQYSGFISGAREGLFPAIQAIRTGIAILPGDAQGELGMGALPTRPQVLPGALGYALETPSRVVQGIHTMFYTMNYSAEINRMAFRAAMQKGLDGAEFAGEVARLKQTPTAEMMDQASNAALRAVLMKRPEEGGFQAKFAQFVNHPSPMALPLKLAMPFMQIGMNILEEGIVDQTVLSLATSEARAELMGDRGLATRDLRLAKLAAGAMIGAAAMALASEGIITGGDDPDYRKRLVAQDAGFKAYSIRIGDTYIPYRKYLSALGPMVAAAADMWQVGHKMHDEGLTKAAGALAFGFSEVIADETWMSGLSNFVKAATNWDTDGERWMRATAVSFLPFSSLLRQTARMVDPYQRQARTLLDAAANTIPGASELLQPQIGIWGQPIGGHMMISPTTATHDPVDARLMALDAGIAPVRREIVGVHLTDEQYTQYARMAGMLAHEMLLPKVQSQAFLQLSDDQQIEQIEKDVSRARRMAAAHMELADQARVQQLRNAGLKPGPSICEQAVANKRAACRF